MTTKYVTLSGGLDLEIPPIEAPSGKCLEAFNYYESVKGGYTTLLGYERYDGLPRPSDATYHYIHITDYDLAAGAVSIAVGATVVIGTLTVTVVLTEVKGDGTELIIIGGEPTGDIPATPTAFDTGAIATEISSEGYASTDWETGGFESYMVATQLVRRTAISPVPGAGSVTGVAQIRGTKLAWRDDSGDSKCYKATAASWSQIPYASLYVVDTSSPEIKATVGDLCNGGQDKIIAIHDFLTAGAPTADTFIYIVKRISGSTPTAFVNDVGSVAIGAVTSSISWTPAGGGAIDYVNHNFYAGTDTFDMFFADGINTAMWYSSADEVIAPISADYTTLAEVCSHVITHNQMLMMSTTGGTYLTSAPGEPDVLDAFVGAHEIGVGDEITGMRSTSAEELAIFTRNETHVVKGKDATDWVKRIGSKNSGAKSNCIASIDDVFASDDRGIARLSRTDALGGFNASTITDDIQSLFNAVSNAATCATTLRALNQMRFFYGTRFLICARVPYNANGNEGIRYGITEGAYPVPVLNVSTEEDDVGIETTYFGSDDGYIYQMDIGSNHDGAIMESTLTVHYNHLQTPLTKKRFVGADIEAITKAPCTFTVYYNMNDGTKTFNPRTVYFPGSEDLWDEAKYDSGLFDSAPLSRPKMGFKGTGFNMNLSFVRSSAVEPQGTLTGYALRYKMRGLVPV